MSSRKFQRRQSTLSLSSTSGTTGDQDRMVELEELIGKNLNMINLQELRANEKKLKAREEKLKNQVDQLENLRKTYEQIREKYKEYAKELHRFRLFSETLSHCAVSNQFSKLIEPFLVQTIPANLDEDQFRLFSGKIRKYLEKSEPYQQIDSIKDILKSIESLESFVGMENNIEKETKEEIKKLLFKCTEQIERFAELKDAGQKLTQTIHYLCESSYSSSLSIDSQD